MHGGKGNERKGLQKYEVLGVIFTGFIYNWRGLGSLGWETCILFVWDKHPPLPELVEYWDSGQGNNRLAPEKLVHLLSWMSGVLSQGSDLGSTTGAPGRLRSRDRERGPSWLCQRPHVPTQREAKTGCLQHALIPTDSYPGPGFADWTRAHSFRVWAQRLVNCLWYN